MHFQKDGCENLPNKTDDKLFTAEKRTAKNERNLVNDRHQTRGKERKSARVKLTGKSYPEENMTNLSINIGRKRRVSANHILGAVAGESGLPGKAFGRIEVFDDFTLVAVPTEHVNMLLETMKSCKINGYKTSIRKA